MFRNLELAIGGVLLLAVLGLSIYAGYLHMTRDAAQEDYQISNGDASAHETYAHGLKKVVVQEKQAHERMEQALEANESWAEQPVPDDVARLLCHSADAACRVPAANADH